MQGTGYRERNIFDAVDAQRSLAELLGVKNLILYHTEDKNILKRQEMYLAEGRKFYHGNLYVPEDLDVIEL